MEPSNNGSLKIPFQDFLQEKQSSNSCRIWYRMVDLSGKPLPFVSKASCLMNGLALVDDLKRSVINDQHQLLAPFSFSQLDVLVPSEKNTTDSTRIRSSKKVPLDSSLALHEIKTEFFDVVVPFADGSNPETPVWVTYKNLDPIPIAVTHPDRTPLFYIKDSFIKTANSPLAHAFSGAVSIWNASRQPLKGNVLVQSILENNSYDQPLILVHNDVINLDSFSGQTNRNVSNADSQSNTSISVADSQPITSLLSHSQSTRDNDIPITPTKSVSTTPPLLKKKESCDKKNNAAESNSNDHAGIEDSLEDGEICDDDITILKSYTKSNNIPFKKKSVSSDVEPIILDFDSPVPKKTESKVSSPPLKIVESVSNDSAQAMNTLLSFSIVPQAILIPSKPTEKSPAKNPSPNKPLKTSTTSNVVPVNLTMTPKKVDDLTARPKVTPTTTSTPAIVTPSRSIVIDTPPVPTSETKVVSSATPTATTVKKIKRPAVKRVSLNNSQSTSTTPRPIAQVKSFTPTMIAQEGMKRPSSSCSTSPLCQPPTKRVAKSYSFPTVPNFTFLFEKCFNVGTLKQNYVMTPLKESGGSVGFSTLYQSISAMDFYKQYSIEELKWMDYSKCRSAK